MALRPSKITSELIQTCNKLFSSSADASFRSKIPVAVHSQKESFSPQPSFRYKISNTGKPEGLPELNFKDEPSVLFAELQPSANPEFKFDFNAPKWSDKAYENSPFPASIRPKDRMNVTYTDQQKADDKMLKCKMACFNPSTRQMSTICVRRYSSKAPADNSGAGNCKKKLSKCYKEKHRDCRVNKDCPKLKIFNCEQSRGSNCKLNYLDPHCTKKFAPYPSYSESCAENLPDDPSECQQCPWRTCDGADTIEPGKPVRNKRHYSTSCSRHLDATSGVVGCPVLPPHLVDVQQHLCHGKCGQTKRPCKQPPGPCEVRRQKEEQKRREKAIHIPPRPKKASDDSNRMVLNSVVDASGQDVLLNPYTLESIRLSMDQPSVENKSSWIDMNEMDEMYLEKKQKHPDCQKKKKPKRPDTGDVDQDLSIEYGNADWWSGRGKKTVIIGKRNITLIGTGLSLSKKKRIKGDEGHPPPCKPPEGESLNCPDKPLRKPKYKKRPMTQGHYKRPEDPYNKSNGNGK